MAQFLLILFMVFIYILWHYLFGNKEDKLEEANKLIGELQTKLKFTEAAAIQSGAKLLEVQKEFTDLRKQKISADVKMGLKSENLAPFLDEFPYPAECVRGLFNPIDLIAFTDDEVVFIEVKSGAAQLSEKQRRIRDNIKAGRVKFEVVRMNEKGVTVK